MGVTSSSQNFEDLNREKGVSSSRERSEIKTYTVVDGQRADIENSSTEIVDDNLAFSIGLVKTVGDSGSGGLVDDTEGVMVPAFLVA